MEMGLSVTRIYQVIAFHPDRVFAKIGEEVEESRRAADRDPSMASRAMAQKLVGN